VLKFTFVSDEWLSVKTKVISQVSCLSIEKATTLVKGLSRIRTWARVFLCRLARVRKQVAKYLSYLDGGHDVVTVIIRQGSGNGQHGVLIVGVRHQMTDRGMNALPRTTIERQGNSVRKENEQTSAGSIDSLVPHQLQWSEAHLRTVTSFMSSHKPEIHRVLAAPFRSFLRDHNWLRPSID